MHTASTSPFFFHKKLIAMTEPSGTPPPEKEPEHEKEITQEDEVHGVLWLRQRNDGLFKNMSW
jgi:hypothetical protein